MMIEEEPAEVVEEPSAEVVEWLADGAFKSAEAEEEPSAELVGALSGRTGRAGK